MWAAADIGGSPYGGRGYAVIGGNPYGATGYATVNGNPYGATGYAAPVDSYSLPGFGGHGPVAVVLSPPTRTPGACRRPRVVVMDTGVGVHPWFVEDPVVRSLHLSNGDPIGMDVTDPSVKDTDPEGKGARPDPMTGALASHAGHGTFIAGLLRQTCPDAEIIGLRIMDADGVVPEALLTTALLGLAVHLSESKTTADALVLSLGYYCETDTDQTYTTGLRTTLASLADLGVTTFAAAGNDCTQRPSFPAAFSIAPEFVDKGRLPVMSVAALNPDGTIALFSNDGQWVNGEADGANLVSTSPVFVDGARQPTVAFAGPSGVTRATIDPDRFASGFATWSGTSFAAPVLAGRFLAGLLAEDFPVSALSRRGLIPRRQEPADPAETG